MHGGWFSRGLDCSKYEQRLFLLWGAIICLMLTGEIFPYKRENLMDPKLLEQVPKYLKCLKGKFSYYCKQFAA